MGGGLRDGWIHPCVRDGMGWDGDGGYGIRGGKGRRVDRVMMGWWRDNGPGTESSGVELDNEYVALLRWESC